MKNTLAEHEIVASVAGYAPSAATVAAEWTSAQQTYTLQRILGVDRVPGDQHEVAEIPLRFLPTHTPGRRPWLYGRAAAASVAALTAGGTAVLLAMVSSGSGPQQAGDGGNSAVAGVVFNPPAALSDKAIDADQYVYSVYEQIDVDAAGVAEPNSKDGLVISTWVAPNGDTLDKRTGSQISCTTYPHQGQARFDQPTEAFFASLPTDVDDLNSYMRAHVEGSSSLDEAVFVAVGDALRQADGLASPRLRAAFIGVLSRTPGVTVRENETDYLGRPAIRADFLDLATRDDEVQSLYFDPSTFKLLGEREGSVGDTPSYSGPSPAYTAARAPKTDPATLTGAAYVAVRRSEQVVDKLPKPCG